MNVWPFEQNVGRDREHGESEASGAQTKCRLHSCWAGAGWPGAALSYVTVSGDPRVISWACSVSIAAGLLHLVGTERNARGTHTRSPSKGTM